MLGAKNKSVKGLTAGIEMLMKKNSKNFISPLTKPVYRKGVSYMAAKMTKKSTNA